MIIDQDPKSDIMMPFRPPFTGSLSGNDFYPLTHICSKEMTYDEKVAYRAKHGIPDTIDKWIKDEKTIPRLPLLIHTSVARHSNICCGRMTLSVS
jgi:hypothetical protein